MVVMKVMKVVPESIIIVLKPAGSSAAAMTTPHRE